MIAVSLALLCAFHEALKDVVLKRAVQGLDPIVVTFVFCLGCFCLLLPLYPWFGSFDFGADFLKAFTASIMINSIAGILYVVAISRGDLSLSVPMLSFSTVFLLITSPMIAGESVGVFGALGVCLVMGGGYLLGSSSARSGLLGPLAALWSEPGPRYMLIVALFWSFSSAYDKVGVLNSSPYMWLLTVHGALCVSYFFVLVVFKRLRFLVRVRDSIPSLGLAALFGTGALLLQMSALVYLAVPVVIAMKRTSVVWTVIFGAFILRESGFAKRLPGAALMSAGAALVILTL